MCQPLSCPELDVTKPSRMERGLIVIPVLGWAFGWAHEQDRFRPLVKSIEAQLKSRADFPESAWGGDAVRVEFARVLTKAIRNNLGWPNDHFHPSDPLRIACWAHQDACDSTDLLSELEQHLKIRLSEEDCDRLNEMNLGEAVDYLTAKSRHQQGTGAE